jgi:putative ABC transport system permease protein
MTDEGGGLSIGRIILDAVRTLRSRPGRSIGLSLAVALGVGAAVGILSASAAANASARARLDAQRPEIVRLRPLEPASRLSGDLPDGAAEAASQDGRVLAVGVAQTVPSRELTARIGRSAVAPEEAAVIAVDGDLPQATRTRIDGRAFTSAEVAAGSRVAIVGSRIADSLAVASVQSSPSIWIDGLPFLVVGIAVESEHLASVADAVLVPRGAAIESFGDDQEFVDTVVYVRTARGAAESASERLPLWISPERPERWVAEVPRDSLDLASEISEDLRNLTLAMAALVLFVGVVAIANAMTRAVMERVPEIGLRRTLGARSEQILGLLLAEAGLVGVLAGVIGAFSGTLVALVVVVRNGWPMVFSGPALALAVPVACLSGVLGGALPSIAAVRITPAQALRRE